MTLTARRAPPTRLDRRCGVSLTAAGMLLPIGVIHPDIFETTLTDAALDTPLWVPIHAVALVAVVLTLVGLTGLYATRAQRMGRLGAIGFALVVPGLVMTGAVAWAEAFLLPVIAREEPDMFAWDGPVTTDWAVRATTGLALLWLVGLILLGLAGWRSGAVPAAAGLTLAGAAVAFIAFGAPLVPVLAPLSTLALAAGYSMVGMSMWSGRTGRVRVPPTEQTWSAAGAGRG